jgi:hypothetical protein
MKRESGDVARRQGMPRQPLTQRQYSISSLVPQYVIELQSLRNCYLALIWGKINSDFLITVMVYKVKLVLSRLGESGGHTFLPQQVSHSLEGKPR